MEKYLELLSNTAEQLARKAAQGAALVVNLEGIERILSAAEIEIKTTEKTG